MWASTSKLLRHGATTHARHDKVCDHQVDRLRMPFDKLRAFGAVRSIEGAIPFTVSSRSSTSRVVHFFGCLFADVPIEPSPYKG